MNERSHDRMPYALVAKLMSLLIPAGLVVGSLSSLPTGLLGFSFGLLAGVVYGLTDRVADRMLVRAGYRYEDHSRTSPKSYLVGILVLAGAGLLAIYWKSSPLIGFLLACLILEAVSFRPQGNVVK